MSAHANQAMMDGAQGMTIGSMLELTNGSQREVVVPVMHYAADGKPKYTPQRSKLLDGEIQLVSMNVASGGTPSTVTVTVHRNGNAQAPVETLVVEASIKPFVVLLWAGTVVMTMGFFLAIAKRTKEA